jgi:phosphate starvation-inducible protein PhoH and related proteins
LKDKIFEIVGIDPLIIFGANNAKLNSIKKYFSGLKIVARGNTLTVIGDDERLLYFEKKFNRILDHADKFNELTENAIDQIMEADENNHEIHIDSNTILVHGVGGTKITARTHNQRKLVESILKNDMVFAVGPAGTGKTYTAVAMAVRALKNKEIRRIILTRPAVEAGENLGFLPGDLKDKLDPYLMPLYDALRDMIPAEKLEDFIESGVIEIAPLAFMRGRTLDKAFVILDEAQNATESQIKMFLTRMGRTAKFVITGDMTQVDLPHRQKSGLAFAIRIVRDIDGIGVIELNQNDVIRHRLVRQIIAAFEEIKEKSTDSTAEKND